MNLQLATPGDSRAIIEFVRSHPDGQIEHTYEGSQLLFHESGGRWKAETCVAWAEGKVVGVMPFAVSRVGRLPLAACRSAGGPLVATEREEIMTAMLQWLIDRAGAEGCCRVELRMHFPEMVDGARPDPADAMLEAVQSHGFAQLPPPRFGTYWLRLGSDEEMLASLSKKCRRDVRKGLREGLRVECRTSIASLREFHRAYLDMCRQKSLLPQRGAYFFEGIAACLEAGTAGVFVCSFRDEPCNMALVTLPGRPRYWLGTTAPGARRKGVPPTGQALHFEIMRHLRGLGYDLYDLGGSPGPIPQRGHPNHGVWEFKFSFGGDWVVYLDKFELVRSRASDLLLRAGYRSSRLLRRR